MIIASNSPLKYLNVPQGESPPPELGNISLKDPMFHTPAIVERRNYSWYVVVRSPLFGFVAISSIVHAFCIYPFIVGCSSYGFYGIRLSYTFFTREKFIEK